ncbi:hypothetical protein [Pseudodesulfovibrio sp. zrk46]|uniref:hypothetical protein n=1 Tax=Pseudodesulfovibrio sp. zrk46 TaxID=2725288 RepID=UPI00144A2686|nr:hypothetical protein [Pseudodesulfovibrio sp. zrk46]QJB56008.1 hypothetical protein HFN16_06090 [Pseudodesulfovibrio sp. zrk46]
MGSPSSRLDIDEQYRPWVDSGLEFLFAPGHAQAGIGTGRSASARQQQQYQPPQRPQMQQGGGMQQRPPYQQQNQAPSQQQAQPPVQQQVQQQAPPPRPQQAPQQGQRMQQPTAQQFSQQPVEAARAAHAQPPTKVQLPEPWNKFYQVISQRVSAPKVVCTYMELGFDLGGQSDPRRRSVLQNTLTHHLKWPPGTAAFWPMSAVVNGALQPNREMFWRGWEIWRTPYIAVFGDEALRVIHPDAQPGSTTYLYNDVTIFVVPPLAKLVTMLPHEQQFATEGLSAIRIS